MKSDGHTYIVGQPQPVHTRGFTLIEVLAALMVFSVAIIGLTHAGSESARSVAALEHKTWAGIIADNQLVLARREPPQIGERTGRSTMMGSEYQWTLNTQQTDTPDFFKMDVQVSRVNAPQILSVRTAFTRRGS